MVSGFRHLDSFWFQIYLVEFWAWRTGQAMMTGVGLSIMEECGDMREGGVLISTMLIARETRTSLLDMVVREVVGEWRWTITARYQTQKGGKDFGT